MADQITQVALETLRDLLIEEVKFLSGVSYQVEEIQRQLRIIHGFLKDVDARQDNSATVANLVADLKYLTSRAEDVLENYAIEVTSKKRGRELKQKLKRYENYAIEVTSKKRGRELKQKLKRYACILREWSSVHQCGKEIERIRSQMADLTKNLESTPSSSADDAQREQQLLLRQTYAHEVEENFVGIYGEGHGEFGIPD